MNESVSFDNKLKLALEIYSESFTASYPDENELEESVSFSEEFYKKMNRLIRIRKRPYYVFIKTTGTKVASILLIILITLSATVFSVKAFRDPVIKFIVETFEKFSRITFQREGDYKNIAPEDINFYKLTYLPEGFEIVITQDGDRSMLREYAKEDDIITFSQSVASGTTMTVDTEGAQIEDITFRGYDGIYFLNKGYHTIVWLEDGYLFYVAGTLEKDEIFKIGENLAPEN
jgi:hypothetical protein